jgi:hypothetical protein
MPRSRVLSSGRGRLQSARAGLTGDSRAAGDVRLSGAGIRDQGTEALRRTRGTVAHRGLFSRDTDEPSELHATSVPALTASVNSTCIVGGRRGTRRSTSSAVERSHRPSRYAHSVPCSRAVSGEVGRTGLCPARGSQRLSPDVGLRLLSDVDLFLMPRPACRQGRARRQV